MASGFIKVTEVTVETDGSGGVSTFESEITIAVRKIVGYFEVESDELRACGQKTVMVLEKDWKIYLQETVDDIDRLVHNADSFGGIQAALDRIAENTGNIGVR